MEDIRYSIIIGAYETNQLFFKQVLESVRQIAWRNMEIQVMDACPGAGIEAAAKLVCQDDYRLHYHKVHRALSMGSVWNEGIRVSRGDYVIFLGSTDCLHPGMLQYLTRAIKEDPGVDLIYTDHDEIVDGARMNPYFLPGLNLELLRHTNYIGETFAVRRGIFTSLGRFKEKLSFAFAYDFLLRAATSGRRIRHIPTLLWHRRVYDLPLDMAEIRDALKKSMREHTVVAEASLHLQGIPADVKADPSGEYWHVQYDGGDFASHHSDVIILKEDGVKPLSKKIQERLYAYIKQSDVAIAGGRFLQGMGMKIDNCGLICDKDGITYPVCHGQSSFSKGLYQRMVIPQDVTAVDDGYCMIDARFFRRCGGFDRNLTGRDRMLDLCLKARAGGMRVVYVPSAIAFRRHKELLSTQQSHERLLHRWQNTLSKGDPFYNVNLPMGLDNYTLS
jgi:hypothetical protein